MTGIAILFLVATGLALLALPRQWAAMPLLAGALYMTLGQGIELGPFNFPVVRLLVAVGVVRVLLRGELKALGLNGLDAMLLAWAAWAVASSLFYDDVPQVLVNRLGMTYNALGMYFLLRCFCQSLDDVVRVCRLTSILLLPVSLAMLWELQSGYNLFSAFGGVHEFSEVRNGTVRAQGPFAHSILAGTVGAVCLPLMVGLWRGHRDSSSAGGLACLTMIGASGSSGPIMSGILAIGALCLWPWRGHMKLLRWVAVLSYVALDVVMRAPAYYLLARIDLTGGSTSWHRAALIEAALNHLSEWWFVGTNYTRHWLPYGVPWSQDHADITNHYIWMGIAGGLPLMLLFIAVLAKGFALVGRWLQAMEEDDTGNADRFKVWALGASLFSHAVTFVSVTYFDQSVVFLYLTLAVIGSLAASNSVSSVELTASTFTQPPPYRSSVLRRTRRF